MSERRALLIDDNGGDATLERLCLEQGYAVQRVTGVEEFERHWNDDVRLVIVSLVMVSVDGVQVLRALAERHCEATIIITGDVDRRILSAAERLARARQLRVAGSLKTPVDEAAARRLLGDSASYPGEGGSRLNIQVARTELMQCLDDGLVDVYYQPKIDVRTLEFVGVEALVRLHHPNHGLLQPSAFLAMAEESGLIGELTRAVVDMAFEQSAKWLEDDLRLQVAVNVSPLLLTDLELPDVLSSMASMHEIDRESIVLEITESWLSTDEVAALDILTRLRMQGFNLSIDDFGTGYSTMARLNDIPYSEMKLDQTFIRNAASDREARAIVESSIELGHKLGIKVVAEGIEKQEDWDLISELRCDEGQGYFIARPMHGTEVPAWLSHWQICLGRQ